MLRVSLFLASLFLASSASAADPKVSSIEWVSNVGGERHYNVRFSGDVTPAASDAAVKMLKIICEAEGFTLDGNTSSSPLKAKRERRIVIGYKKEGGDKPVMQKAEFVSQVAGTAKYKFVYSQKPDASTVNSIAEVLSRAQYDVDPADKKVKAKTETTIEEKVATVTITFTGGLFQYIK
jgi:hypothetical protein